MHRQSPSRWSEASAPPLRHLPGRSGMRQKCDSQKNYCKSSSHVRTFVACMQGPHMHAQSTAQLADLISCISMQVMLCISTLSVSSGSTICELACARLEEAVQGGCCSSHQSGLSQKVLSSLCQSQHVAWPGNRHEPVQNRLGPLYAAWPAESHRCQKWHLQQACI